MSTDHRAVCDVLLDIKNQPGTVNQRSDILYRFMAKVRIESDGCWVWTGAKNSKNYGCFSEDGKSQLAHRWIYERVIGPIPERFQVDHVKDNGCTSTLCVWPMHLEAVLPIENNRRSNSLSAINARKTHCDNGHEFTDTNTIKRARGNRECRTCVLGKQRESYAVSVARPVRKWERAS